MNETNRPFIKHVDPQVFLIRQFMHYRRGEVICPNCGLVCSLNPMDDDTANCKKKCREFCEVEQFKAIIGLCSEQCSEEFLGGVYHVFKQQ